VTLDDLASTLRTARALRRAGQRETAIAARVDQARYARFESAFAVPRLDELERLAYVLDVPALDEIVKAVRARQAALPFGARVVIAVLRELPPPLVVLQEAAPPSDELPPGWTRVTS
jgi:transcriptional regulator with XRE-family HTH domain